MHFGNDNFDEVLQNNKVHHENAVTSNMIEAPQ